MDTSETMKDMFSSWMKWQQRATDMWGKMAQNVPRPQMGWPAMGWPSTWPSQPAGGHDMIGEWMKMSRDLFDRFGAFGASGLGNETAGKSLDAVKVYWALYDYWTKLVKSTGLLTDEVPDQEKLARAHAELAGEYEKVMQAFLGSPPPTSFQEMMKVQGDFMERTLSLWGHFRAPWQDMRDEWPAVWQKLSSGEPGSVRESFGIWQKTVLDTVGRLINLPALGMSRQYEERLKSALDAYLQFQAILPVYYSTFQTASRRASERLFQESRDLAADTSPEGFRKFYRRWVKIHEDTYFELFRKPEFAELMNKVVDRGLTLRQRINELSKQQLQVLNVPTQEEMDHVYRSLYEHRSKIKELERRILELEAVTSEEG
jgi:class III poly(R)-hydroxyalkanoic acid synthase PhaE subunit